MNDSNAQKTRWLKIGTSQKKVLESSSLLRADERKPGEDLTARQTFQRSEIGLFIFSGLVSRRLGICQKLVNMQRKSHNYITLHHYVKNKTKQMERTDQSVPVGPHFPVCTR